jgi:DNA-binding response OmpR family regulator
MACILVCDDDADIVAALEIYLRGEGYDVEKATNGKEALEVLSEKEIHLVLLDVMMPVMDGIKALSLIREQYNVPVILLTAKGEDMDKVLGLNLGADDYIVKPFNAVELLARVRSSLRRYMQLGAMNVSPVSKKVESHISIGGIELDDDRKEVKLDGEDISLTPTEYEILYLLMSHPGKVYSPAEIYREVRKEDAFGSEGMVAVHIRHLREKLEYDPAQPRHIVAVWGHGYRLE